MQAETPNLTPIDAIATGVGACVELIERTLAAPFYAALMGMTTNDVLRMAGMKSASEAEQP